jgi:hypothetical protein
MSYFDDMPFGIWVGSIILVVAILYFFGEDGNAGCKERYGSDWRYAKAGLASVCIDNLTGDIKSYE